MATVSLLAKLLLGCALSATLLAVLLVATAIRGQRVLPCVVYLVGMATGSILALAFLISLHKAALAVRGVGISRGALLLPAIALIEAGLSGFVGLTSSFRLAPLVLSLLGGLALIWLFNSPIH